jgi:hypothetical protein
MSQTQKLANQTRIIIKDVLFQAHYLLTHTQMDLMADLPILHPKTLESTLSILNKE